MALDLTSDDPIERAVGVPAGGAVVMGTTDGESRDLRVLGVAFTGDGLPITVWVEVRSRIGSPYGVPWSRIDYLRPVD